MSNEITLEKEITKLGRYLVKEGRRDFVDEARGLAHDPSAVDAKILGLAKHREEIKTGRDTDTDLKKAKDQAKALGATYRKQLAMNEKLTRFLSLVASEKA